MRRPALSLAVLGATLVAYWLVAPPTGSSPPSAPATARSTAKVMREPLTVWATYLGRLEPKSPVVVMSWFRGNSTVVELAAEGARVSKGDVLARLDSSAVERDIVKLEKDHALAESELVSFRSAKAPLELQELLIKLNEARAAFAAEQNYLAAIAELAKEGVISRQEIAQQKDKVEALKTQVEKGEMQVRLTREYLHPSELKRAQARLAAAEHELMLARQQLRESVIRAPSDGLVIHMPLHVGNELRTLRAGDSLYPNLPFMMLHDMKELVVQGEVPEGELSRVQQGQEAIVTPLAYPELRLRAVVERISPMAKSAPGQPAWQKSFQFVVRVLAPDARLRPGMSVTTHVLAYHNPSAISVPRSAVSWHDGKPFAYVRTGEGSERRALRLGAGNDKLYEVLDGLQPGAEVAVE
jgi:multidrug resistance efflux pump